MLSHVTHQEFPLLLSTMLVGGSVGATLAGTWVVRHLQRRRVR